MSALAPPRDGEPPPRQPCPREGRQGPCAFFPKQLASTPVFVESTSSSANQLIIQAVAGKRKTIPAEIYRWLIDKTKETEYTEPTRFGEGCLPELAMPVTNSRAMGARGPLCSGAFLFC
jgi:hypothetical protein